MNKYLRLTYFIIDRYIPPVYNLCPARGTDTGQIGTKMKKIYLAAAIITTAILLVRPGQVAEAVKDAALFSVYRVIPALFCFMVLSKLIMSSDIVHTVYPAFKPLASVLHLSRDEFSAFVTGNLCGFPSGAYSVKQICKSREYDECRRTSLAALSNNVSPGFAASFAGDVILGSKAVGMLIYASQLISSLIICSILRRNVKCENEINIAICERRNFAETFCKAVTDSSHACVNLIGFIVMFSVVSLFVTSLLERFNAPDILISYIRSFLEITGGCMSASSLPINHKVPIIAFSCGFSGLCVIFQSAPYLYGAGIKLSKYILIKIIQGVLSAVFSVLIIKLAHIY